MAIRPNKTGGNQTYTAEVAGGNTTIKASEVDNDFLQLYTALDDSNILVSSIATNRLRSDAGITIGMLGTDSVTTAKILNANVTQPKLSTDSVTTAKIVDANVTQPKLAIAVTVIGTPAQTTTLLATSITTSVTTSILQLGPFTPRSTAPVFVSGGIHYTVTLNTANSTAQNVNGLTLQWLLYDDAAVTNLIRQWPVISVSDEGAAGTGRRIKWPLLFTPAHWMLGSGTAKTWTLRLVTGVAIGGTFAVDFGVTSNLTVTEFQ